MLDAPSSSCLRCKWGVQDASGFHKLTETHQVPFLIRVTLPVCCGEL